MGADGSAFDPEHLGQLVHRRARPVAGDQLLGLVACESPGTPRPILPGRRWRGRVEAGERPTQLFESPDLGFWLS
jgi:hypothetical protein